MLDSPAKPLPQLATQVPVRRKVDEVQARQTEEEIQVRQLEEQLRQVSLLRYCPEAQAEVQTVEVLVLVR